MSEELNKPQTKSEYSLTSPYGATDDQRRAAGQLTGGVLGGQKFQTLLGVTGSGKTFTMAQVIERSGRPALVISHNKTLAWQLYREFKEFFPKNEVHYFVSYYDYYQPEAYLPSTDTYIEKDAKINEVIDKLRHGATQAVLSRDDVIVVASVSCIYNIGDPGAYRELSLTIKRGMQTARQRLLRDLVRLQYERDDYARKPGTFEVKGETVTIYLPTGEAAVRVRLRGDVIEAVERVRSGEADEVDEFSLFPAKHFVSRNEDLTPAIDAIRKELSVRLKEFGEQGKVLEAARLQQRTNYDIEMLTETGYVGGIENYSRHLSGKKPGEAPETLLDYFSLGHPDFVVFVDESHMTLPQIRGMSNGDRARKEVLIEHGFRLPSALDNRPLTFDEWVKHVRQAVFVSATPGEYELEQSHTSARVLHGSLPRESEARRGVAEQLLRPTHILDPSIEVRGADGQVGDLVSEIQERIKKGERALVTVITKRLAEDLAEHLKEKKIKAAYLHSDIHTLDRPEVLASLRRGDVDVLVGINLLREGLDLPEVSLVAILDADKEGFLRNETTLVQTMGRAARHPNGKVIMYADEMTDSMRAAIRETRRRREYQRKYNKVHGLAPLPIVKAAPPAKKALAEMRPEEEWLRQMPKTKLKKELKKAVDEWDFEKAIIVRDILRSA